MPSRATSLLLSLFPFGPARLRSFPGVLFALLCREFLSRGVSAPPSELDSRLILFRHVFFALTMRTAAHSVDVATERVLPTLTQSYATAFTRAVGKPAPQLTWKKHVCTSVACSLSRLAKRPNSPSEWGLQERM